MRDELADHLVPCLTGRTWKHEDFYWTLVFIKWASEESSERSRVRRFLQYERWLKLLWAKSGRKGFTGVREAERQAFGEDGGLIAAYSPLLKSPQFQGMLGAHLKPLRTQGFVHEKELLLLDDGCDLVKGAGAAIEGLRNGDLRQWKSAFKEAANGYSSTFRRKLRSRLRERMLALNEALSMCDWIENQKWKCAARHMDNKAAPFAALAGEFISWADEVRNYFQDVVDKNGHVSRRFPCPLQSVIPPGLDRWGPLRRALRRWGQVDKYRLLADWHQEVFAARGYQQSDLWLIFDDGKCTGYAGRALERREIEGGDCRWRNAVRLMRPEFREVRT